MVALLALIGFATSQVAPFAAKHMGPGPCSWPSSGYSSTESSFRCTCSSFGSKLSSATSHRHVISVRRSAVHMTSTSLHMVKYNGSDTSLCARQMHICNSKGVYIKRRHMRRSKDFNRSAVGSDTSSSGSSSSSSSAATTSPTTSSSASNSSPSMAPSGTLPNIPRQARKLDTLDDSSAASAKQKAGLATLAEVQAVAASRGLTLSLRSVGPAYWIECKTAAGVVVGATNGFVVPLLGLMHCEKLEVFTKGLRGEEAQRVRGGVHGLGLLLGLATFSHGLACGCRKAEILAIKDDDYQHERLVKYYKYFGFQPVLSVGSSSLSDLPHLLVWGGEGTRMDADVKGMLKKWTPALRRRALQ